LLTCTKHSNTGKAVKYPVTTRNNRKKLLTLRSIFSFFTYAEYIFRFGDLILSIVSRVLQVPGNQVLPHFFTVAECYT